MPVPREHRLLPAAIDYIASVSPDRTFAYLPKGENLQDGFEPLSWARYAKAIDQIAWWLDDYLDGQLTGDDFPTVAYVGPNDMRYAMIVVAAAKTKRKVMLPFPANTIMAQTNLLKHAKCEHVVFGSSPSEDWITTLSQMPELKRVQLPDIANFLSDRVVEKYAYKKSFEEGLDDPLYVIQTSGTTGNPKPIVISNRNDVLYFDQSDDNEKAAPGSKLGMFESFKDAFFPNLLPFSWIAGIAPMLHWSVALNVTPVLMPTTMPQPMTSAYIREALSVIPRGDKNCVIVVPDALREVARDTATLESFRSLDCIGYVGAPLDRHSGDVISKYARVQSFIGATDTGAYPILETSVADWHLIRFKTGLHGFHLQHFNEDTYELCITRQPHDPRYCFQVNPDIDLYHTKDLFRAIPGREGYFTSAGRIDDFVKLASMTKFSATAIEQIINQHPKIKKTFIGGDARERTFAIVELKEYDGRSTREVVDELWPAFEEANKTVYGDAQLTKELILITDPELPIKQTAKGSVDRRTTLSRYEGSIEKMFESAGFQSLPAGADGNIR